MEHLQDDTTDEDQAMRRSLEWYSSDKDEDEKKRKEKDKKAKKKRQQEDDEASGKAEKQAKKAEEEKAAEKKPSFLEMLIDGDKPKVDSEKNQTADSKSSESAPGKPESVPKSPESTANAEVQSNPAELSPDEEREATLAYITERQARLAAEASQQPAEEQPEEIEANQSFLQKLAERLHLNKEASTDEILDATADEVIAETVESDDLDDETEDPPLDEHGEVVPETPSVEDDSSQEIEDTDHGSSAPTPPSTPPPPVPPVPPIPGGTPPPSSGGGSSGGGGGGFSGGGSTPTGGMSSFGGSPDSVSRFAAQPAAADGEIGSRGLESATRRKSGAGEFLLGAFVGYLFGRRRGRIKSEAEAEPIKKGLEKQVKDLQQKIETRETQVRSAVQQKSEAAQQPEIRDRQPISVDSVAATKAESEDTAISSSKQEAAPVAEAPTQQTELPDRQSASVESAAANPAAEAKQPFARSVEQAAVESLASMQPEQVQQSSTQIESKVYDHPERSKPKAESVAVLPLQEVLRGADHVPYKGESLRNLYESGRISERTLRDTYREFLRGHKYEQQLERSLRQDTEAVSRSPEFVSQQQASHTQIGGQSTQANGFNNSSENLSQSNAHEHSLASADLPPVEINPSIKKNHIGNLSPGQQVSIGAAIGIFVVVIILLFWPR